MAAPIYKTILPSLARTTTQTGVGFAVGDHKALHVVLDMTVVGTGSVTVSIDGYDKVSAKWYNLLTGAAVVTNSTNVYKIGPALVAAANAVANDYLPGLIRVTVTANNANSATYSVGACLI